MQQIYSTESVLDAAKRRIAEAFDDFPKICVSVSGGKDSTALCHLVLSEAMRRGRRAEVFFLDEEVDYDATIEQVSYLMFEMMPEATHPVWLQVPFCLTNATSLIEGQLLAWDPEKEGIWMRPKDPRAIHAWPEEWPRRVSKKVKGFGFYDAVYGHEAAMQSTCCFVGLRADESLTRRKTVTREAGHKDWLWTTKGKRGCIRAYPLYDWTVPDMWKYIAENGVRYNKIYDLMYQHKMPMREMRVSSLIHEKSFKAITELQEFEPDTYDRLCRRISGIQTAGIYGKDDKAMRCQKLPKGYKSWAEYRDFLLATYPDKSKVCIFEERFAKQGNEERMARQQCRQLLLNDYENNLPAKASGGRKVVEKWAAIL